MLKIGDFSKLSFVSVKTLRFYDEMGLLKPVEVDRFTGYRYYSASQLPQLNRILMLKDLGLSLEEIARLFKEEVPLASILDIVRVKQGELKNRLQEESERLNRVEEWLEQLNKEGKMPEYEVVIKKVPPQKVASVRDVVPTYHDITILFGKICPYLEGLGNKVQYAGPPIALYYDKEYMDKDVDIEVAIPIVNDIPVKDGISVRELPGYEQVASAVHKGRYENMKDTYQVMLKWIEDNGYKIIGPDREIYMTDPKEVKSPDDNITEVQFPIAKA